MANKNKNLKSKKLERKNLPKDPELLRKILFVDVHMILCPKCRTYFDTKEKFDGHFSTSKALCKKWLEGGQRQKKKHISLKKQMRLDLKKEEEKKQNGDEKKENKSTRTSQKKN